MGTDVVKGHLDGLLLGVLLDGPRHGYGVISELRDRTEGAFDLPEGTVYPALHRLQDLGLLASDWEHVAGRRRRVYWLTDAGRAALAREKQRWRSFAAAVDVVLLARPASGAAAIAGGTA
jgi:DNA-binding PadR family transcriptional regulator